ncbi:MAG: SRPBCC family protein [Bdellovibrionales bacterium]|nr:SRPBCC family protein [Bdellovibrionales bacterium]
MFSLPFVVEKSIQIDGSKDQIFKLLTNFDNWRKWSPWLCLEPECEVTVENPPHLTGHKQTWSGHRIGSGSLEIRAIDHADTFDCDLYFLKPWKSYSDVRFTCSSGSKGSVTVNWHMKGSLPIFVFFLKKMMQVYVGKDFERGLLMLKELCETGQVPTQSHLKGEADQDPLWYIGRNRTCKIEELGQNMQKDFEALQKSLDSNEIPQPNKYLSLYRKFDFASGICDYTAAYGYTHSLNNKTANYETGSLPGHKSLVVDHIGPYRYLSNAWSTVMSAQRALKKKVRKDLPMYEVYNNRPDSVEETQLSTEIHLPIRL